MLLMMRLMAWLILPGEDLLLRYVPLLENSAPQVVKYAADDETHGMVDIAWRGPAAKVYN